MKVALHDIKNKEIDTSIFDESQDTGLVHRLLVSYQAGLRKGTKSQKNRSAVTCSGKKLLSKGTGGARPGNLSSPLRRGGGVTFAQRGVRNYEQKINKKMAKKAMRSLFSILKANEKIIIVSDITDNQVKDCKTKSMLSYCQDIGIDSGLIVVDSKNAAGNNHNLELSCRNLKHFNLVLDTAIDPHALLKANNVCITESALKNIEERLA